MSQLVIPPRFCCLCERALVFSTRRCTLANRHVIFALQMDSIRHHCFRIVAGVTFRMPAPSIGVNGFYRETAVRLEFVDLKALLGLSGGLGALRASSTFESSR